MEEAPADDGVRAGQGIALARTRSGQVAGYVSSDILTFKGIPYADTTAGEHRFMPPRPAPAWEGVRSCRHYGPVAPQDKGTGRFNDEEAFIFQWNDSVESEDCLRLNIWTPGTEGNARRAVMVWLHGGGYAAGSSHDLPAFDGENLARQGDVVVVSLNHRLNLLGFLDLSAHGDRYAASGNVGMLDIVAALEWIRDNIAAFGGDPARVMIFGQSGGGAKVSTLMGMPAAQGLFHRAGVMSGSFTRPATRESSRRLTDLFLAELGLDGTQVERLHTLPYLTLRQAAAAVTARENAPFPGFVDVRAVGGRLDFGPVVDGEILPAAPFGSTAPAMSRDVPMIIGSTLNEFVSGINQPDAQAMDEAELQRRAEAFVPGRGGEIVAAVRARTPDASPFDLWSRIATSPVRQSAIDQAAAKASAGGAPAYLYWFTWQTPVLDGRPAAFHCLDIPFVFANTARCASMTGGGASARRLSDRISAAFVAFAKTGNPRHADLPSWPPFNPTEMPSMVFDDQPGVANGPDRDELARVV
ncbi:Para-nitrobenzyl esterase [Brevundimonas subvibrioides]|uniref:carboxylesterase/lipase family protein n=1 Tax=Brevundimonas subvibrioides TaxID=74313 RepID=UPI0032D58C67